LRDLWHPERDALAGGHVRLLRGAEIGKSVSDLARVEIEGAAIAAQGGELFFRADDENRSCGNRDPSYRSVQQSHCT
jgi:hypothetical protein